MILLPKIVVIKVLDYIVHVIKSRVRGYID